MAALYSSCRSRKDQKKPYCRYLYDSVGPLVFDIWYNSTQTHSLDHKDIHFEINPAPFADNSHLSWKRCPSRGSMLLLANVSGILFIGKRGSVWQPYIVYGIPCTYNSCLGRNLFWNHTAKVLGLEMEKIQQNVNLPPLLLSLLWVRYCSNSTMYRRCNWPWFSPRSK